MSTKIGKQILSVALCLPLIAATTPMDAGATILQEAAGANTSANYAGQGAPLTAVELQGLLAPIALYPDALVAQILAASTYPDQVAVASYWLQQNKGLTGSALMQAVNGQPWDPSVKALTQFPSVLHQMAQSLTWTSQLGDAYYNQPADVMAGIQVLRGQAKAAGNLKSGPQITVVQQTPQTIVIEPTNPEVVYVPVYNPAVVYGTAYVTTGYSTGDIVATSMLSFGAGIAVGAMMSGGCCGWGYASWGCNWYSGSAYYHGGAYYGNNGWHGGYYGSGYYGSHGSAYGANGSAHYGSAYNSSTGAYARGGSASTPYGHAAAGQTYNPNTGKGAEGVAAAGRDGNTAAAGETANGNKYAEADDHLYKNTGSGWEKDNNGNWTHVQKPTSSSDAAHGWGDSSSSHASSSPFSGFSKSGSGNGWQSRASSARGWASRGGGGFGDHSFSGIRR